MKRLLNTLYVFSENKYLALEGENVVVLADNEKVGRVPLHNLESIVTFGYTGASPALMGACAERNIDLCFMKSNGHFLARVTGKVKGNVLLRKEQYRVSDDKEKSVHRSAVLAKSLEHIRQCEESSVLLGLEGEAASVYFSVFDELILQQKDSFYFNGRNKRPPLDNVNALLSFAYSMLAGMCGSALEAVGLDPYVGFFHTDRLGRMSLALDLMEEFRSVMTDRIVLSLINKRKIKPEHFVNKENGAVLLTDEGRKIFIQEWQNKKKETIKHPYIDEKIEWGMVPYVQAMLLARFLRGDMNEYPPFFWK